jgi:REP element-mobilizing transposase RayT
MSQDRITYLERIEHYRQRFGFLVYAYVLMVNHIHFLVETRVEDRRESRKRIGLNGILESRAFLGSKQFVRKLVKEKTTPPECAQLLLTVCQRKLHALSSLERAVG